MGLGLSLQNGAREVVASAMVRLVLPERGLSHCRPRGWIRWWNTTPMPAAAAARAGGRGTRTLAPSGDREPADHATGDRE
jgi:hypothetical protein